MCRREFFLLATMILAAAAFDTMKSGNGGDSDSLSPMERFLFGQQSLVHTFGTAESCARNCPRQCIMQEVEDLMMPRWICTNSGTSSGSEVANSFAVPSMRGDRALDEETFAFSSQLFFFFALFGIILLVFLIIWCRRCSANSD